MLIKLVYHYNYNPHELVRCIYHKHSFFGHFCQATERCAH